MFAVLDITQGYHQAPLTLAALAYTAFILFCGVYQFTRLPSGPKQAPSYFQQIMTTVVLAGRIDGNIQQITDVIISIEHTVINVMEDTDTSLQDTTSIGIIQNMNINTLQQRLQNNVPDNNNPQETNEIIPIEQTEINVMNNTVLWL